MNLHQSRLVLNAMHLLAVASGLQPEQVELVEYTSNSHFASVRFTYLPSGTTWQIAFCFQEGQVIPALCSYLPPGQQDWLHHAVEEGMLPGVRSSTSASKEHTFIGLGAAS
jgi:hypothetical protein